MKKYLNVHFFLALLLLCSLACYRTVNCEYHQFDDSTPDDKKAALMASNFEEMFICLNAPTVWDIHGLIENVEFGGGCNTCIDAWKAANHIMPDTVHMNKLPPNSKGQRARHGMVDLVYLKEIAWTTHANDTLIILSVQNGTKLILAPVDKNRIQAGSYFPFLIDQSLPFSDNTPLLIGWIKYRGGDREIKVLNFLAE